MWSFFSKLYTDNMFNSPYKYCKILFAKIGKCKFYSQNAEIVRSKIFQFWLWLYVCSKPFPINFLHHLTNLTLENKGDLIGCVALWIKAHISMKKSSGEAFFWSVFQVLLQKLDNKDKKCFFWYVTLNLKTKKQKKKLKSKK